MTAGARYFAILILVAAATAAAADSPRPRRLLVLVRDTPPQGAAGIVHGADGSYSVSTGSGDRDERAGSAADNATLLSTGNGVRRVHVREGERVRVELPAVQSLQFHLPAPGGTGQAASGTARAAPAPAASGVVYFDAVAAFAARFALAGSTVRIELAPLRIGTVSAPYAAAAPTGPQTITIIGRVGQWIALGDTELPESGASLNATADPPRPATVWLRVEPEPADSPR